MLSIISNSNRQDLSRALALNDIKESSRIAMEECAELTQAISKMARYGERATASMLDNLIEEIADVMYVIEEQKMAYGISDEQIQEKVDYKSARLMDRIDRGDYC